MNKIVSFLLMALFLLGCTENLKKEQEKRGRTQKVESTNSLAKILPKDQLGTAIPLLEAYQKEKQTILARPTPVMLIPEDQLDNDYQKIAQQVALIDPRFTRDIFYENKEPLHTEIMNIREMSASEMTKSKISSLSNKIPPFKVELYNYFFNTLTVAIVDVNVKRVLKVDYFNSNAPEVNQRLKKLAVEIAVNTPEVLKETGASSSELKGSLYPEFEGAKCERSRHLCTNLVFTVNKKIVTVLVDLTELHVIGVNAQPVTGRNKKIITERTLQNEYVSDAFCGVDNDLEKDGWSIKYELTSSDGLEIKQVHFNNKPVIESAKLVDWHVSYTFKEGFGYSDAMGCPMFSAAAVVAFSGPEVEEIKIDNETVGFTLVQDFRSPVWPMACNYRYQNRFEFYKDGSFRIAGASLGLGCGAGGWYRPVFRIAMSNAKNVALWDSNSWSPQQSEFWNLQSNETTFSPEGYLYKVTNENGNGYYIEPANGQFGLGDRGDNAYSYFVVKHPGEGDKDIPTFGPCCNESFEQGPEIYLNEPEPLNGQELILWYVPQIENDDRQGQEFCWAKTIIYNGQAHNVAWPGIVGPKFVPVN